MRVHACVCVCVLHVCVCAVCVCCVCVHMIKLFMSLTYVERDTCTLLGQCRGQLYGYTIHWPGMVQFYLGYSKST